MIKRQRQKLTVARRVQILYNVLKDITGRFISNEAEVKRQEQVFFNEAKRQITNHARDLFDDTITHFKGMQQKSLSGEEIAWMLGNIRKHIPCDEPDEEFCLNCDRPLTEHGQTVVGDINITICYAMPYREMLVVGIETAKILSERLGIKLDSQDAPHLAGTDPAD